jgi:hypothetical protein
MCQSTGRCREQAQTGPARGHLPRKRFGQHFLTDAGIIDAIVQAIAPRPATRPWWRSARVLAP